MKKKTTIIKKNVRVRIFPMKKKKCVCVSSVDEEPVNS